MTEFRFETPMAVRYRDLDPFGHVNNAVYVTYLEHARVDYAEAVLDLSADDLSMVVAHLDIDYKHSVTLGDDVTVALGVTNVGNSSFEMQYEIRSDGETAATARSTQVAIDTGTGKPTPVPDVWRDQIEAYESLESAESAESAE